MICRLCLKNLNDETPVFLFESSENFAETGLLKMIAKYIYLELSQDDPISTTICQECCEHLENFHTFWLNVDQKQNSLRNEFMEVKCNVELYTPTTAEADEGNEELPLDMKYIPMDFTEPESVDNAQSEFQCAINDADSIDDDVPLMTLLGTDKLKSLASTKRKRTKRNTKQKNSPKANHDEDEGDKEDSHDKKIYTNKAETAKRNEEIISNFMTLSCDLCNCLVDNYANLRSHFQLTHKRAAYVKCCGRSFKRASKLVEHINWHQDPDSFRCSICDKQLRTKYCLEHHKNSIHAPTTKAEIAICHCHICNKPFRSQKCLEKHVLKHETESENKEHICEICNKSFVTSHRLLRHIESIHQNIHPHICDICGKKFKFKPSFETHLLEHQGIVEPPEQCKECGKWLKNKHTLRLHRFKHDTTNVDCHFCGRKCRSRTALRGHINYMHKQQNNFQCNYCEKSFKVEKNLKEHVAIHTGAQLYSCPHCSKECRSKSNMYVHIKRYHVLEWMRSKEARSNNPNSNTKS